MEANCSLCKYVERVRTSWTNTSYEGRNMKRVDFQVPCVHGYCRNDNSGMKDKMVFSTHKHYEVKPVTDCKEFA